MKKFLSLVLVLCMALSMLVLPAFAAEESAGSALPPADSEAKAIATAEDFLKMEATGNYKLTADITLTAPYEAEFTGTFDGQGHTVTVKYPMFVNFGGTAKNLVIEGEIKSVAKAEEYAALSTNGARGALAALVKCGTTVVFENIKNNAKVSAIGALDSDDCAGGLVGKIEIASAEVKFVNCENTAEITGLNQVGGFVGYAKTAKTLAFENCKNSGYIHNTESSSYCGGLVCRTDMPVTFEGCVNTGKVYSGKDQAGGLVAYATTTFTANNCFNSGEIGGDIGHAGGIVANVNANKAAVVITNCVNTGNLKATSTWTYDSKKKKDVLSAMYAGGIAARVQHAVPSFTITGCFNSGKVVGENNCGGIVGHANSCANTYASYCFNSGEVISVVEEARKTIKGSKNNVSNVAGYAGGIFGYAQGRDDATLKPAYDESGKYTGGYLIKLSDCVNAGNITGVGRCGGIVGSIGASSRYGIGDISNAVNTGDVTCTKGGTEKWSQSIAAGIVGYTESDDTNQWTEVRNCITTGNIKCDVEKVGRACYFIGAINSSKAVIENNIASGTLTASEATDETTGAVIGGKFAYGWNNGKSFASVKGNQLPKGCEYALTFENGTVTKTADAKEGYAWTESDIKTLTSGEYVYNFNKGYKSATKATEDALYMTVDGEKFAPTTVKAADGSNAVIKKADGSFANYDPESTEPTPATGDNTLVMIAMFVVAAVAVVALLPKKRTER